MRRAEAAVLVAVLLLRPAAARDSHADDPIPLPPRPPPSLDVALPPYESKLDRLAELMGALAFLRDLCGDADGATWRDRMDALLKAEGTTATRRNRLAGSYNRGYEGYRLAYNRCTPAAGVVIARALADGARIAAEVSAKFAP